MTFQECKKLMMQDASRFSTDPTGKKISLAVSGVLRIGNYLRTKDNTGAKIVLKIILFLNFFLRLLTGIQINIGTQILGGIKFPHWSCIVIAQSCKIGEYCTIHQGVTIGQTHFGRNQGYPTIGNNVLIYAGAKICGKINVGNNVVIGANAVVTCDIPDNCIVVGHNRIISTDSYNVLGDRGRKLFWKI